MKSDSLRDMGESDSQLKTPAWALEELRGLPARLRFVRDFLGWSQKKLAEVSGVDQGTISRIENGDAGDVRASTLVALSAATRVTLDWLATGQGPAFGSEGAPIVFGELADQPRIGRKPRKKPKP